MSVGTMSDRVCAGVPQVLRAELVLMKGKMDEVRVLAQELMATRGENCQAQVGPRVEQLSQRFAIISDRITSGLVTSVWNYSFHTFILFVPKSFFMN